MKSIPPSYSYRCKIKNQKEVDNCIILGALCSNRYIFIVLFQLYGAFKLFKPNTGLNLPLGADF